MVRVDNQQGAPAEIGAGSPSVSVLISKTILVWDVRQKVAV